MPQSDASPVPPFPDLRGEPSHDFPRDLFDASADGLPAREMENASLREIAQAAAGLAQEPARRSFSGFEALFAASPPVAGDAGFADPVAPPESAETTAPSPITSGPASVALAEGLEPENRARGTSLIIAGTGLLVLSCWQAWLSAQNAAGYFRSLEDGLGGSLAARAEKVFAWLHGCAALFFLSLALGSLRLRRWIPKVMIAGSWLVALGFLLASSVVSSLYFFIAPPGPERNYGLSRDLVETFIWAALLGLILPLVCVAIFQRHSTRKTCEEADTRPGWSDQLGEPVVMVSLLCAGFLVAVVGALLFHAPFPWTEGYLVGPGANAGWGCSFGLLLLATILNLRKAKAGLWLGCCVLTAIAALFCFNFLIRPYAEFAGPLGLSPVEDASASSKLAAMMVGAFYLPSLLIFFMARSSYEPIEETTPEAALRHV